MVSSVTEHAAVDQKTWTKQTLWESWNDQYIRVISDGFCSKLNEGPLHKHAKIERGRRPLAVKIDNISSCYLLMEINKYSIDVYHAID